MFYYLYSHHPNCILGLFLHYKYHLLHAPIALILTFNTVPLFCPSAVLYIMTFIFHTVVLSCIFFLVVV